MVKLKIECWWTDPGSIRKRFIEQFVSNTDLEKYEFTLGEDYDYLVVFNFTDFSKISLSKDKIFVFSQEPVWSPNDKKDLHLHSNNVFVADLRAYPSHPSYKEVLLPMLYGGKGDLDYRPEWNWGSNLFVRDFSKEKTQAISMVASNIYNSHLYYLSNPEISEIIYKWRVDTSVMISENCPAVHIWGAFQPDNNRNLHGVAWNKLVALQNFRFSICVENSIQKNYISEKFWDAVLTDTVPIYLGCNNISDYIDSDCYIDIASIKDDSQALISLLTRIAENSEELYAQYLPRLKKLKEQYITDRVFNVWEKIKYEINLQEQ